MSNAEAATITRTKKAIKEPPLYRVIYINDNTTTTYTDSDLPPASGVLFYRVTRP